MICVIIHSLGTPGSIKSYSKNPEQGCDLNDASEIFTFAQNFALINPSITMMRFSHFLEIKYNEKNIMMK